MSFFYKTFLSNSGDSTEVRKCFDFDPDIPAEDFKNIKYYPEVYHGRSVKNRGSCSTICENSLDENSNYCSVTRHLSLG